VSAIEPLRPDSSKEDTNTIDALPDSEEFGSEGLDLELPPSKLFPSKLPESTMPDPAKVKPGESSTEQPALDDTQRDKQVQPGPSPTTNQPSPAGPNALTAQPLPKIAMRSTTSETGSLIESVVASPQDFASDPAGEVTVVQGDSFWLIAQRVYGDGRYFDALYQFNKDRVESFNELQQGQVVVTPPEFELRSRWPRLCPREQMTTIGGETLFEIASQRLGQASRYVEILKLNYSSLPKDVNQGTELPAGVLLKLPRPR